MATSQSFDLNTPEGVQSYLRSPESFLASLPDFEGRLDSLVVTRVSGGLANHTYRVSLDPGSSMDGNVPSLILKYSPPTIALNPDHPLTTKRGFFEYSALANVPNIQTSSPCRVHTPSTIHYDEAAHLLAISDAGPHSQTLKQHLLDNADLNYSQIGQSLGEWLAELHQWGQTDAAAPLRSILSQNLEMADVGLQYTFAGLVPEDDPLWSAVRSHVESLRKSDDNTGGFVVHGDFWTGNVLVSTENDSAEGDVDLKLTVLDWEASNCRNLPWNDIGQMCSEMYEPTFFGHAGEKGTQLVSVFVKGYLSKRKLSKEEARLAIVRFGVHLFVWPAWSGWGNEESVARCKELGREYVERAWNYDWKWLKGSVLGDLVDESFD
ncbi:protein kinase subdomain-containing protein PKL [Coprinopsis cinerea AmutBmut pab1-1]|nr:protein kinase subdomain-containing protein PKL [Coprinopsis cinerea AmutBmut pab1-1]